MKTEQFLYGTLKDGRTVPAFKITNEKGAYVELIAYGATLNKIVVPDKNGVLEDVLVGFDTLEGQLLCTESNGRTVGRVANRIAGNGITIDGKNYPLTKNVDGKFTLHGNHEYATALWNAEILGDNAVKFSYDSKDGNEGFPGNVHNEVTMSFSEDCKVKIHYEAHTDAPTAINMTNHAYFNLAGYDAEQIVDHEVQLFCDAYTPTNTDCIPTGEIRSVAGTPFDFRQPKTIRQDVDADDEQLKLGIGYDHNFAIADYDGTLRKFAIVKEPKTGRVMTAYTDLPGVQFYIGNWMGKQQIGKGGKEILYRQGFCLETQYFPDAMNHDTFIPCLFTPEKPYISETVYAFSAE